MKDHLGKIIEKEIEERCRAKKSVNIDLMDLEIIKDLLDKAEPVAPRKMERYEMLVCACCDSVVVKGDLYCSHCGQRIDTENVAL